MIILIDNYDSFSYNLYQAIGEFDPDIRVIRNDEMTVDEIESLSPRAIILSPGPGRPEDAGICEELIRRCYMKYPILGVCLGHQAICEAFGGTIIYAKKLYHGKSSLIECKSDSILFRNMKQEIQAARYHSLIVENESLPDCLEILAETGEHEIMAVSHKEYPVYGLQFHPESILTPEGKTIIANFLEAKLQ